MEDQNKEKKQAILWSCICRDEIILCEAGQDDFTGSVTKAARKLLAKNNTPGWEFYNHGRNIKGMKFHLFQRREEGNVLFVWKFAAIYNAKEVEKVQVMSFLEKMVALTEYQREEEDMWKHGDTLACQSTFAPILLQRMEEVSYLGRMAMVNQKIDSIKEHMASNIEMILENGEKLEEMQTSATHLEFAAKTFKKRSKDLKRLKMWQNAKYGLAVGTAVTGVVAVIAVPPLLASL
mmetsp:Transcript_10227/g.15705  ORF Transcript_10227/g.15705 Transcript_10227/m.15705 type:complete len:235 (-) Transcript_10227:3065-3769(-)